MAVRSVASDTAEFVAVRRCCWPASMARWLDDRGMFWPVVEQPPRGALPDCPVRWLWCVGHVRWMRAVC